LQYLFKQSIFLLFGATPHSLSEAWLFCCAEELCRSSSSHQVHAGVYSSSFSCENRYKKCFKVYGEQKEKYRTVLRIQSFFYLWIQDPRWKKSGFRINIHDRFAVCLEAGFLGLKIL
jgi:hypothetical protein